MKKLRMKRYDYIESQKRLHKLTYDMDFCALVLTEFYELVRSAWAATRHDSVELAFFQYCWFTHGIDAPGWVYYDRNFEKYRILFGLGWLAKHSDKIRVSIVTHVLDAYE